MSRVNGYTIGELARAVGVPTSTIRYYERTGLLRPDARSFSNYRQYTAKTLDRLRFILLICAVVASGFAIRELVDNWHDLGTQFALRLFGIALAIIGLFVLKRPWALRWAPSRARWAMRAAATGWC